MVSLSTDILQTIDLGKNSVPNLNSQGTFDWFGTLPKRCQELFEDAVLISDRRKSVYGKWDDILSSIHISPTCVVTKRALAQFFTPPDVALYTAFNLLDNYQMEVIFDPCVGYGSLLIATALVLSEKEQLSNWDLVKKLHGSEIDQNTRNIAIKNIAGCLVKISPLLEIRAVEKRLEKQIKLCDFNNYPNKTLSGLRIIANPPYKEGAKGNIWIPIIDKLVDSNLASMSLILPVAISSSKRAQFLRNKIFANFKKIYAFHHEIRPCPLFRGVDQRISIITATKNLITPHEYITTGFLKHTAGNRMMVWKAPMTKLSKNECNNVFPKVSPLDIAFFKEFESGKNRVRLSEITITTEHTTEVWIRTTGRYHLLAQYEKPAEITTKWKRLLIPDHIASNFMQAFKNGDLLKWWQIFGDGRDISITSLYNNYRVCL